MIRYRKKISPGNAGKSLEVQTSNIALFLKHSNKMQFIQLKSTPQGKFIFLLVNQSCYYDNQEEQLNLLQSVSTIQFVPLKVFNKIKGMHKYINKLN